MADIGVFAEAGLDSELADSLYAVESDPGWNPFAADVVPVMCAVASHGCRIGILSDIHFDLRPVFAAAELAELVDAFVLSYEHGVQKPDPSIFRIVLGELETSADSSLMVGDRASHDGAAVDVGMPVLLLPPLRAVTEQRLHHVENMVAGRQPKC